MAEIVGIVRAAALMAVCFVGGAQAQQPQPLSPPPYPFTPNVSPSQSVPIDPTKNVLDLVTALKEMLAVLRVADKELLDARLKGERDLNELRSRYDKELLRTSTDRLDSEAKLRAEFNERYALTEKGRVDAIRLVDKNAVDVATAGSVATATALAKTVQDTAENSRKLVETTALETNRNIQQQFAAVTALLGPIGTRIAALEQAGAEGIGRSKFQDPNVERITRTLETLLQAQASKSGVDTGTAATWAIIATIILILVAIGGFGLNAMRQRPRR
jgi:hypothetical protein